MHTIFYIVPKIRHIYPLREMIEVHEITFGTFQGEIYIGIDHRKAYLGPLCGI
jgi:hypothetical protein